MSVQPQPGQVVTVFRSRLRTDADAYPEHAAQMSALARTMPGYVEHKSFTAEDGERVTLVTFADRLSHDAWGRHPEHREAQRAGVRDYYEEYSISVGTVERVSAWTRERREEDAGGFSSVLLPPGR
jgi:heme-degrading monooxygenase HmoA